MYDSRLVALSIFIAISASYGALDLGARVTAARGWIRSVWVVGGATAMGLGIWSMHFTGMLAFRLPIQVAYHWPTVLVSLLAAIFGSAVALYVVSREKKGRVQWLTGSVVMGLAIAGMHYIGMAAMRLSAVCHYSPLLVSVSVLIAVIASLAAIVFTFDYREDFRGTVLSKLLSAGVMGGAISLMHYTGMMSANFFPSNVLPNLSRAVGISSLGLSGIAIGALVVQGVTILTSSMDRQIAVRAQELQTSDRFRQIADTLRDVLILAKPDFSEILFVNRAYEAIWGRTLESLYADPKSWLEGVHPEDRERVQDHVQLLIGGQPIENLEFRVVRPEGSISWVRLRTHPILDDQGHWYRVVGSIHEFTKRKQAEDAHQQVEEQYRTVAETATDAVVSIDENSQILFANPATTTLFGYDSSELTGRPLTMLMPQSFRELHKASLQRYLATGQRHMNWQGVELVGLRKGGTEFPVEVSFGEVTKQGRRVFTGFIRDITERKRAEDRVRQVIDTIPALVWSALPDGSRDFLNQPWMKYSGLSRDEALGWGWTKAVSPEDRAIFVDEWHKALASEEPFEREVRFRRADGEYRWFLVRAVPLRNEQGKIVKWYGTSSDIDDRKRTEDSVRLIIETIPTLVWTLQPDGAVDFVNQRWMDYTGISLEEAIKEPSRPIHPEDLPRVVEKWRKDFAAGKASEDELRLRRADGEYRWFLIRTMALRDERGNVVKWYGVSIDIEDRKRAEDRLRLVLDTTPALIHTARPDGYLDYFNKGWLEYVGLTLEDLQGWGWTDAVHPQDVKAAVNSWRASIASGEPFVHEVRIRRADGEYRWMLARKVPLRNECGNIVKWFGSIVDIEDRKRAERQSRELIDAIPQQIWSSPPDGTLDYCNERWRSYTGLGLEQLRGDGWQSMLHPDDRERVLKAWHESVTNGTPYEQEERHRRADGQYRWFLARGVPLRDADGRILRWYGTNTDIEDRKQAEEKLERLSGQLLQSQDEERRRISRELHDSTGQNLAALTTYLSQLETSIPSTARELCALASRCQELAVQCVREVRTLSYLMYPPMLDETGLADAIRHFVDGFTTRSGIKVELEVNPNFGRLKEDVELALFRVVQESLTNIHRHSGSIRAKVLLDRRPDYVTVEVRDTGRGTSNKNPGTSRGIPFQIGIGISSMIERVKLIGGRLEIVSGAGGTTVRATVPEGGARDDRGSPANA
jgi:PAS domain S-box-containing protein